MTQPNRALVPWNGAELLPADGSTPIVRIGQPDPPPPRVHETKTPRREPKLEGDVFVPGLQAVFTALAGGIMAALLALAFGWSWKVPVVILALALAGAWLWRLRVVDSLLWTIETWVDQDLNGDNLVGRPAVAFTLANPAQARQAVTAENRQAAESAERVALLAFADACFVKGTSEGSHGITASGPDRDEYTKKRDALLSLGVARWKNPARPKAGWLMAVSRQRAHGIIGRHVL